MSSLRELLGPALLLGPGLGVGAGMLLEDFEVRIVLKGRIRSTVTDHTAQHWNTHQLFAAESADRLGLVLLDRRAVGMDLHASARLVGLLVLLLNAVFLGDRHVARLAVLTVMRWWIKACEGLICSAVEVLIRNAVERVERSRGKFRARIKCTDCQAITCSTKSLTYMPITCRETSTMTCETSRVRTLTGPFVRAKIGLDLHDPCWRQ